jgi:hypothetical protein
MMKARRPRAVIATKTQGFYLLPLAATMLLTVGAGLARSGDGVEPAPWVSAIRAMDEALTRGDVRAALRAREDARLAALASPNWEGVAMVGDATLRLGRRAGLATALEPGARRAYVFALHRARRQGSLEGVLYVTEAFAGLGDRDMTRRGLAIAEKLAVTSRAPHALERVRALRERLAAEIPPAGGVPAAAAAPREGGSRGAEDGVGPRHGSE